MAKKTIMMKQHLVYVCTDIRTSQLMSRYVPELANHSPLGLNFTEDTAFV